MKMKAVLSSLLLAALTGTSTSLFWKQYIQVDEYMNWSDAQAYCRESFVDLMTVENMYEEDVYQNSTIHNCTQGCWIGLSRETQKMDFAEWSDGTSVTFTHWGLGEPSNGNCVYTNTNKHWHTDDCTITRSSMCYIWQPDLIVVQEMMTWEEALNYCRMKYTDLVSISSDEDSTVVNIKISEVQTPSFWTSLRFFDGSWLWMNLGGQTQDNMSPCPEPPFRCGAQNVESNVLENRDCEEKMNFICYQ